MNATLLISVDGREGDAWGITCGRPSPSAAWASAAVEEDAVAEQSLGVALPGAGGRVVEAALAANGCSCPDATLPVCVYSFGGVGGRSLSCMNIVCGLIMPSSVAGAGAPPPPNVECRAGGAPEVVRFLVQSGREKKCVVVCVVVTTVVVVSEATRTADWALSL